MTRERDARNRFRYQLEQLCREEGVNLKHTDDGLWYFQDYDESWMLDIDEALSLLVGPLECWSDTESNDTKGE